MIHTPENVAEQFAALRKRYHMFDWRQDGPFALVATNNGPTMTKPLKFRVAPQNSDGFRATMAQPCVVESDIHLSACEAFSDLLQRLADFRTSLQHVVALVHLEERRLRESL